MVSWLISLPPSARSCALRLFTTLALLSATAAVNAQWMRDQAAEARRKLGSDTSDLARLKILVAQASEWVVSNKAIPYLLEADTLSLRLLTTAEPGQADAIRSYRSAVLYYLGYQMKYRRDIPAALHFFRESLALSQTLPDKGAHRLAGTYDALGVLYQAVGEPTMAEREFRSGLARAWEVAHLYPDYPTHLTAHLAGAVADQGRVQEALAMLDTCTTNKEADVAKVFTERARIQFRSGRMSEALHWLLATDSLYDHVEEPWDRVQGLVPLTRVQLANGDPQNAMITAGRCAALAAQVGDEAAECGCLVLGAQASLALGQERRAEQDLLHALGIARDNGYMGLARELGDEGSMVHITSLLKDLYRRQGRTAEALEMTSLWAAYKDTLQGMAGREDIMRFELRRQLVVDSMARAEELHMERRSYEERLSDERVRRYWIVGSSVLALLLLSLLAWSFAKRRRQESHIAAMEMQRLEQERMISEMRIREQVGRDMHDDLGAGLSALRLRSELAQRNEPDPAKQQLLGSMALQAGDLITSMRQIIWAMRAEGSDLASTVAHCIEHAREYLTESGIDLVVERRNDLPDHHLSATQRRNLFLLIKEALHNVVKHAQATEVSIVLDSADALHISIHDNGIGFDPTKVESGSGLTNMRKRTGELGGTIVWDHAAGTRIEIDLPLAGLAQH